MGRHRFETLATALVSLSLALGCSSGEAVVGAAGSDAGRGDVADDAAPGTLPDFADGTRLKALTYVLDDGTKVWRGWWDSQRNEECSFAFACDGKSRCLPAVDAADAFSDAQCTSPLEIVFPGTCGPLRAYLAYPSASSQGRDTGGLHKRLARHLARKTGMRAFPVAPSSRSPTSRAVSVSARRRYTSSAREERSRTSVS
jgi:hypothetical protein